MLFKDRHLKSCCAVCAACPVPGVAYFTAGPVAVLAESYQCKIPSAGPKPGFFSAPNNISGCPVLGASCDISWPYYFLIVLVTAVSGCENISLNQTFICHYTGVHVQAPAFSSRTDPLQHQLPREQTGNTMKHWNGCIYWKESRGWYSNKLHSDKPTTTPRLMGHKKQTQTHSPLQHGVTQVQLRKNKHSSSWAHITPGNRSAAVKGSDRSWQPAPPGEAPNTQLKLHCLIQLTRAVLFYYFFICKVNKNPLLGT